VLPSRTNFVRSRRTALEDRVRLRVGQRLHDHCRIELAERRRLFGDELDIGLRGLSRFLNADTADWPYS